ncbi:hypothetical protein GGTG_08075 [Gaeumannomyces tritici R3-111a-1]|uniref:Uncharacterized protein n=1 Tax=Gaeumannomyces tritici (strain R3-111a-1) TaxID=644352 RepID=J3P3I8_GAET3|nr:hypothetical protein GGTG_08075 [Gaeumannomyces tritici R3-111a-1]EJT74231.1 hypothetical protein GGTG_08075 [Gaeumannomyces tritici R3-111a-1]
MTDPTRRVSSEAVSSGQSPAASIYKSVSPAQSPALPQTGGPGGPGISHWPERRRLSSNSATQPQSLGIANRPSSGQASISSQHQRQPPQQQRQSLEPQHEVRPDQLSHHLAEAATRPPIPPRFTPVFALVDDGTTRTTHHPRVHYIFADDNPDVLTEALTEAAAHHPPLDSASFALPLPVDPRTGRPPDRAILLDLVPSANGAAPGFSIAAANSLSADFAVTSASLSRNMDDSGPGNDGAGEDDATDGHLVLRIEGVSAEGPPRFPATALKRTSPSASGGGLAYSGASSGSGRSRGGGAPITGGSEEFVALAEDFDRRMDVMRRVVEAFEAGAKAQREADRANPDTTNAAAGEGAGEALDQRRGS